MHRQNHQQVVLRSTKKYFSEVRLKRAFLLRPDDVTKLVLVLLRFFGSGLFFRPLLQIQ